MSLEQDIIRRAKKLNKISNVEVPRAAARALNLCAVTVRTKVISGVARAIKIPAKHIRKKTFFTRATAKKQRAKITAYTKPVSVVSLLPGPKIDRHMGTGTNRKGVRAAKRQFDHAFINTKKRTVQVFRRKSKLRLPLDVIKIDIHDAVDKNLEMHSKAVMKKQFKKLLLHELTFRLSKYVR